MAVSLAAFLRNSTAGDATEPVASGTGSPAAQPRRKGVSNVILQLQQALGDQPMRFGMPGPRKGASPRPGRRPSSRGSGAPAEDADSEPEVRLELDPAAVEEARKKSSALALKLDARLDELAETGIANIDLVAAMTALGLAARGGRAAFPASAELQQLVRDLLSAVGCVLPFQDGQQLVSSALALPTPDTIAPTSLQLERTVTAMTRARRIAPLGASACDRLLELLLGACDSAMYAAVTSSVLAQALVSDVTFGGWAATMLLLNGHGKQQRDMTSPPAACTWQQLGLNVVHGVQLRALPRALQLGPAQRMLLVHSTKTKLGLREGDVIVALDGQLLSADAQQEVVREAREEGDLPLLARQAPLRRITVLRRGDAAAARQEADAAAAEDAEAADDTPVTPPAARSDDAHGKKTASATRTDPARSSEASPKRSDDRALPLSAEREGDGSRQRRSTLEEVRSSVHAAAAAEAERVVREAREAADEEAKLIHRRAEVESEATLLRQRERIAAEQRMYLRALEKDMEQRLQAKYDARYNELGEQMQQAVLAQRVAEHRRMAAELRELTQTVRLVDMASRSASTGLRFDPGRPGAFLQSVQGWEALLEPSAMAQCGALGASAAELPPAHTAGGSGSSSSNASGSARSVRAAAHYVDSDGDQSASSSRESPRSAASSTAVASEIDAAVVAAAPPCSSSPEAAPAPASSSLQTQPLPPLLARGSLQPLRLSVQDGAVVIDYLQGRESPPSAQHEDCRAAQRCAAQAIAELDAGDPSQSISARSGVPIKLPAGRHTLTHGLTIRLAKPVATMSTAAPLSAVATDTHVAEDDIRGFDAGRVAHSGVDEAASGDVEEAFIAAPSAAEVPPTVPAGAPVSKHASSDSDNDGPSLAREEHSAMRSSGLFAPGLRQPPAQSASERWSGDGEDARASESVSGNAAGQPTSPARCVGSVSASSLSHGDREDPISMSISDPNPERQSGACLAVSEDPSVAALQSRLDALRQRTAGSTKNGSSATSMTRQRGTCLGGFQGHPMPISSLLDIDEDSWAQLSSGGLGPLQQKVCMLESWRPNLLAS